jgi:hypothetical protein
MSFGEDLTCYVRSLWEVAFLFKAHLSGLFRMAESQSVSGNLFMQVNQFVPLPELIVAHERIKGSRSGLPFVLLVTRF